MLLNSSTGVKHRLSSVICTTGISDSHKPLSSKKQVLLGGIIDFLILRELSN